MTWRGRMSYQGCLAEMEEQRAGLIAGDAACARLILCEHAPVVTRGRSSEAQHLLMSPEELERRGIELCDISRGGDVTYHGPGQLMIYPVVRVGPKVAAFMEAVAETLANVAQSFGVAGARWRRDEAGLWLSDRKLAACGLHLRHGVSIHGFSLNVCTPPAAWNCIVPCGLPGPGPISLAEAMPESASVPTVAEVAERALPLLTHTLARYGLASAPPLR